MVGVDVEEEGDSSQEANSDSDIETCCWKEEKQTQRLV